MRGEGDGDGEGEGDGGGGGVEGGLPPHPANYQAGSE